MALPKQVRDAGQRSDDAIAALKAQAQGQEAPTGTVTDPPPNPQEPTQPAPKDTGREDWKAKYLTLQGKYDAEVPRLSTELKAANARITELTAEVSRLKAEIDSKAAPAPAAPTAEPGIEIPPEIRELLGEDAAKAVQKIALDTARAQIAPVEKKADAAAKTAEEIEAERAAAERDRFLSTLRQQVPNYQEIDAREDWKAWLAEADPFSGRQRQALITAAVHALDHQRVANFFKAFMASAGIADPASPKPSPGVPAHLEEPAPSGRPAAPTVTKKVWKKSEVTDAYKRIALGKLTREEAASLQAELVAAVRENRIKD